MASLGFEHVSFCFFEPFCEIGEVRARLLLPALLEGVFEFLDKGIGQHRRAFGSVGFVGNGEKLLAREGGGQALGDHVEQLALVIGPVVRAQVKPLGDGQTHAFAFHHRHEFHRGYGLAAQAHQIDGQFSQQGRQAADAPCRLLRGIDRGIRTVRFGQDQGNPGRDQRDRKTTHKNHPPPTCENVNVIEDIAFGFHIRTYLRVMGQRGDGRPTTGCVLD